MKQPRRPKAGARRNIVEKQSLHGVVVPIITPTDAQERVDEQALRSLIRRLIAAGVHGIFAGGTTGEGPLLTFAEWQRMAEISFDECGSGASLVTGVMDTSASRVIERVRLLRRIGCRCFVLTPSFYIAAKTASEQLRLFSAARDAAGDMEMVAYNIPQCAGVALDVGMVCDMARKGWIRYCKESSGDLAYFRDLVKRGKEAGLSVLAGDEVTMVEELKAGAAGIVPGAGNIAPALHVQLWDASTRADWDAVSRLFAQIKPIRAPLVGGPASWVSGFKYAASLMGIGTGKALVPLEPMAPDQAAEIKRVLTANKLL